MKLTLGKWEERLLNNKREVPIPLLQTTMTEGVC